MSGRDEILCFGRAEYAYLMRAGGDRKIWGFAPQQRGRIERQERVRAFVRLAERGVLCIGADGPVLSEEMRRIWMILERAKSACLEEYMFPDGMRIKLSCRHQEGVVVQEPARGGLEIRIYERSPEEWRQEVEERLREIKSFVPQQGERLLDGLEAVRREETAYAQLSEAEWERLGCHMRTSLMRRTKEETRVCRTDRIFDGRSSRYLARIQEEPQVRIYTQESAAKLAGEWSDWMGRKEEGKNDFG